MQTERDQSEAQGWFARLAGFVRRFHAYLTAVAVFVIFALAALAMTRFTADIRYEDVLASLSSIGLADIALAVAFTGLSFVALCFYDYNALDYIGHKVPTRTLSMTAFAAYAIGNTVGFGALSGGAIRYRAYSRLGLSPTEIGKVIAFVTLSFGLGLLAVSALALLAVAPRLSAILAFSPLALRAIALIVLLVLTLVFLTGRDGTPLRLFGVTLALPDSRTASRQFLVSAFDIAASATVLYVLLPDAGIGWPVFLAIYAVAIGIGVISHVPAGLGVFEAVIMAGLGHAVSLDQLLGSLVLYRLIYHVLPLLVAFVVVIGSEVGQLMQKPLAADLADLAARLAPSLLAAIGVIAGVMLIFSAVTPSPDETLALLSDYVPLLLIEAAHFLSSLLGLALVIAARGLAQRLDGAWWMALAASILALMFAFLKSIAPFEAVLLLVFATGLLVHRRAFNRPASLFRQALSPAWIAAMLVILAGAATVMMFVYRDTQYSHDLWWQFEFAEEAPRGLRALLGVTVIGLSAALLSLLRPAFSHPEHADADAIARAIAIVERSGNSDANLVRMADKRVMFSQSGNSFIMYGMQGRSLIALGDPVGQPEEFGELAWSFVEAARAAGGRAVFYQASTALLPHVTDVGLRAFKLGEAALVDLSRFDLASSRLSALRQAKNKGLRMGLGFAILSPAQAGERLEELKAVSDSWLRHHDAREKTFSLGAFTPDYVTQLPVAILTFEGRIVAFATILLTDTKEEGSVDLMRFLADAPKGAMDFLFVSIMEHFKAEGFVHFNLGMAPLAGMSDREIAPVWDRFGRTVYEHGERFYNFRGLRAFKSKFLPDWQPRYLAVAGAAGAIVALMDVTILIGGGLRGVVKK